MKFESFWQWLTKGTPRIQSTPKKNPDAEVAPSSPSASEPPRSFTLQSYEDEFYTGSAHAGTKVLMGLLCPHVVTYFFDSAGALVKIERQLWNHPAPKSEDDGPYQIYDDQFVQSIGQQIRERQKEIGFQEKPIRVLKFADEDVGIKELPGYLEEAIRNDPTDEELAEEVADFKELNDFVFCWAKEYWMSVSGEVVST
jgi:hypothetical protein